MIYLQKLYPILLIAVITSMIVHFFSMYFFEVAFLIISILAGIAFILYQKELKSYKFLDKLVIGSLIYGFLTIILMIIQMYIASLAMDIKMPYSFFHYFNFLEYAGLALVLSFISFMGGLVGIVIKGFYILHHNTQKSQK